MHPRRFYRPLRALLKWKGVYFREKDGKIEILAKSNKDNQNKVIGILQKMGY